MRNVILQSLNLREIYFYPYIFHHFLGTIGGLILSNSFFTLLLRVRPHAHSWGGGSSKEVKGPHSSMMVRRPLPDK